MTRVSGGEPQLGGGFLRGIEAQRVVRYYHLFALTGILIARDTSPEHDLE